MSLAAETCSVCGGPFVTSVLLAVCDVWTIRVKGKPKMVLTNPRHGYHEYVAWNSRVPEQGVLAPVP